MIHVFLFAQSLCEHAEAYLHGSQQNVNTLKELTSMPILSYIGNSLECCTNTVEPLIKDTLNKGYLCVNDASDGPTYIVSIMNKMIHPNVSEIPLYIMPFRYLPEVV